MAHSNPAASRPDGVAADFDLVQVLTRRQFVAASAATLGALVAAACAGGETTAPLSTSVAISLANYPTLANTGGIVRVSETSVPVALERTGATSFVAYSLICPHQGGTVNVTGNSTVPFQCPVHGAQFNASGANVGGQVTGSLSRYTATFDATANTVTISP